MNHPGRASKRRVLLAFGITFGLFLMLGGLSGIVPLASASPAPDAALQQGDYAGPEACAVCHDDIHELWQESLHARAFSSPIFQQNWSEIGSEFGCLACHTTGYDPAVNTYAFEGVTCEACHGPFQEGHPVTRMPITADHELCATCHETTTDEWLASKHGQIGIECQACHNPHAQGPKAASVTELCSNCHKEPGNAFTHGTHSDAGLQCSNCHMFSNPRIAAPIEGLVPTGHTFTVGSDACVGCHQDTVHTRSTILELTGEVEDLGSLDPDQLRQRVHDLEEMVADLEANVTVRLYTGLAQGGFVGLATGGVAAWIVSRGIRVVEVEDEEDGEREEDEG